MDRPAPAAADRGRDPVPRPEPGTASGSSVNGRSLVTTALPKGGTRLGLTARRVAGQPDSEPSSKTKWLLLGGVAAVGVALIGLIAWRPWASSAPQEDKSAADSKAVPAKTAAPARLPPTRPSKGFSYVVLDVPAHPTPPVVNGELRETPTDVIYMLGYNLTKATAGDPNLAAVFRRDAVGGVLPYGLGSTGVQYPNTFWGVDDAGGVRPLAAKEYQTGDRPVAPTDCLLLKGAYTLKPGLTELNALVTDLSDITAGPGGSTVKVNAGAVLLAGDPPGDRDAILGAGAEPLTIDFAGRTGYLTVTSDQDFIKAAKGATREHQVRARLTGFGDAPLVVSGMWGNVVGLRNVENDFPRLVVQGLSVTGGRPRTRCSG